MPTDDIDQWVAKIIVELSRSATRFVPFRDLAQQLTGDLTQGPLIAGYVGMRPEYFVVSRVSRDNAAVKLSELGVRAVAQTRHNADDLTSSQRPPVERRREIIAAVQEYARQLRTLRLKVVAVDRGEIVAARYLHALTIDAADDDIRLVDDTPVQFVTSARRRIPGHVVGTSRDEAVVYAALFEQLAPEDAPGRLEVSQSRSWFELIDYLETLGSEPRMSGLLEARTAAAPCALADSDGVARQLAHRSTPYAGFLWGAPGAGKTRCLARLAEHLLVRDSRERIVVLAPSNVAVDGFVRELLVVLEETETGRRCLRDRSVLRFGYPRDPGVLEHTELFGPQEMEELSEAINVAFREVRRLATARADESSIARARSRLRQLQETRRQAVLAHLGRARLVATTVASAFAGRGNLHSARPWTTCLLDEASMVSGAITYAVASLSAERVIIAGDPRQLAPVFSWESRETVPPPVKQWLDRDPFEVWGLSTGTGIDRRIRSDDGRLALITTQRRCHPAIWSLVGPTLYPTITTDVDTAKLQEIASAPPTPGQPVEFQDVGSGPVATGVETADENELAQEFASACRKVGRSWENPSTAERAIDIARSMCAAQPGIRIAIIAPYRGQVRLIRRWLNDEAKSQSTIRPAWVQPSSVDVGTVHAFQGGQADAVILDLVDGPPRPTLGHLLSGDNGLRLANVAFTRSRGKLVIVGSIAWLSAQRRHGLPPLWDAVLAQFRPTFSPVPRPEDLPQPRQVKFSNPGVESPIEDILVTELKRRRAELPAFELQSVIRNATGRIVSRADVAFPAQRLAVYCDGAAYHLNRQQWQKDLRQRRELGQMR